MIASQAKRISSFCISNGVIDERDREKFDYCYEVFLSTLLNFAAVLLIGLVTGSLWHTVVFMLVFAVLKVPDNPKNPDYINYFSHHTFSNDAEFEEYIRELKKRSLFSTHLSAEPEDALLELSTCIGDSHLIVVARRLRKQESQATLMETINYFVVQFRGSPIVPWDLFSVGTAASVAGSYTYDIEPGSGPALLFDHRGGH